MKGGQEPTSKYKLNAFYEKQQAVVDSKCDEISCSGKAEAVSQMALARTSRQKRDGPRPKNGSLTLFQIM